ncbi:MAG TPA: chromate resistance protein ChrB domain-containing protein [Gemmatimonadota bacterium]|nr:chromate resistance protein ChrB domain-containing protein [Gemmatimonadota bacterium]
MNDTVESERQGGRWLVLTHQIPPEPAYFRVRVRRRLAGIGAVPLKNSVYVLPEREDTREDFEWLLREIVRDGGEGSLAVATFVDGVTDRRLEAALNAERDDAYAELAEAANRARERLAEPSADESAPRQAAEALPRLAQRLEEIREIDFLGAPGREEAEQALALLELELRKKETREVAMREEDWSSAKTRGRTWVTRRGVKVDRTASAWLVRRFIDPDAHFKFVEPSGYRPEEGELRFDMFDGEFTHEGERCTFETLLERFGLAGDPGLAAIAEIVHDLDLKEKRYDRAEAPGVASILAGIARRHQDDVARIERGAALFDDLYENFRSVADEPFREAVAGPTPRLP